MWSQIVTAYFALCLSCFYLFSIYLIQTAKLRKFLKPREIFAIIASYRPLTESVSVFLSRAATALGGGPASAYR